MYFYGRGVGGREWVKFNTEILLATRAIPTEES